MNLYADSKQNILINQAWEDFQEELAEQDDLLLLDYLNRSYNRKGYTLSDYTNADYIHY